YRLLLLLLLLLVSLLFFSSILLPHLRSTLFPYTTLFRSNIPIHPDYPSKYDRLLCGGIWCILQLDYEFIEEDKKNSTPIRIRKRSEEHTSELQSRFDLVCRLLLEKKKNKQTRT